MSTEPFIRVVAAAITDGERVLAGRRAVHKRQAGCWELPGGKVEKGESDAAALAREISEELGMIIEVGDCLAESDHRYAHGVIRLVAYRCRWVSGEPRPTDHDRIAWIDADEASGLPWAPADVPLLDAVFGVSDRTWLAGETDGVAQP